MASVKRRIKKAEDVSASEIEKTMKELRARYGDKTVVTGREVTIPFRIPLGIFEFDLATLGGIPHNRCSMFHGPKHSGKSTASLRAIKGAQITMPDSRVALVDVEGTLDKVWAGKVGVDLDKLIVVQSDTGEQAVDTAVALTHTKEISLIVIDSLAALLPMKEQESSAEDSLVAQQSRLITSMLRKVSAAQITERKRDHYVTLLNINQQRTKIGGWSPTGDPLSLPGGKALGFFNSLEVRWKNKETIKKDASGNETLAFNEHAFTIEKNKMNGGIRTGEFQMMRRADPSMSLQEADIDDASSILGKALQFGWYTGGGRAGFTLEFGEYDPIHFDNGNEAARYLYENREFAWELRSHLIARWAEMQGMPEWYCDYIRYGQVDLTGEV